MEILPNFTLVGARSVDEVIQARAAHPASRLLGGGTDLIVNIRRGIVAPPVLIDVTQVDQMTGIRTVVDGIDIGAAVRLMELATHAGVARDFPALAQAATSIAGPTHRHMGTVGGNLCLDTRCIFYNQSGWWRGALDHCLKTTGDTCHVAPKSRGVCFATFSGDLAPALLIFGAEIEVAGPRGRRILPLDRLYIGHARQDQPITDENGDGKHYLSLRPGEFIVAVRIRPVPGLHSGYEKMRIRRSIEYPVAGVAVGLRREDDLLADLRIAFTGTNPRPVLLAGTMGLCARPLDDATLADLDRLIRDQLMAMKTSFTPGYYRRRIAGVLARRLVTRLFAEAVPA